MAIKIINAVLILFAVFMGFKQGWAMLTGKPQMLEMFGRWDFGKSGVMAFGAATLLSAILILFPRTFIWGNFLMAAGILLIICLHLGDRDPKGVGVELPFFLLNWVIIYLRHPFADGH